MKHCRTFWFWLRQTWIENTHFKWNLLYFFQANESNPCFFGGRYFLKIFKQLFCAAHSKKNIHVKTGFMISRKKNLSQTFIQHGLSIFKNIYYFLFHRFRCVSYCLPISFTIHLLMIRFILSLRVWCCCSLLLLFFFFIENLWEKE